MNDASVIIMLIMAFVSGIALGASGKPEKQENEKAFDYMLDRMRAAEHSERELKLKLWEIESGMRHYGLYIDGYEIKYDKRLAELYGKVDIK